MMRYYDTKNNRLIYIANRANENYWDEHWKKIDTAKLYRPNVSPFNSVVGITKKYLPLKSLIVEGGAGLAVNSWYLHLSGYRTIAIDFAPNTVSFLKKHRPEVRPNLGDVRKMPLESESVDGYWSFGVIEHFYKGYKTIVEEMYRVIRKDGYLFLTFPHMSKLRQFKAKRGFYEKWCEDDIQISNFYQFALDDCQVISDFEKHGFKLIMQSGLDGVKGLKDEISIGKKWLQGIYSGKTIKDKLLTRLLDVLLRKWFSHVALLVFKKRSDDFSL